MGNILTTYGSISYVRIGRISDYFKITLYMFNPE